VGKGASGLKHLPRRIPATNCETLAWFSPQTAKCWPGFRRKKPDSLRRSTPETGVRYMSINKTAASSSP